MSLQLPLNTLSFLNDMNTRIRANQFSYMLPKELTAKKKTTQAMNPNAFDAFDAYTFLKHRPTTPNKYRDCVSLEQVKRAAVQQRAASLHADVCYSEWDHNWTENELAWWNWKVLNKWNIPPCKIEPPLQWTHVFCFISLQRTSAFNVNMFSCRTFSTLFFKYTRADSDIKPFSLWTLVLGC